MASIGRTILSRSSPRVRTGVRVRASRAPFNSSARPNLAAGFSRFSRTDAPEKIIEAQKKDGACIIERFLTPETLRQLNSDVDAPLQQVKPGAEDADPALQELVGKNTRRLSNLVTYSKTWREGIINDDVLHGLCHEGIGKIAGDSSDYWLSMAHMIEIGPGSSAQPLHVDGGQWWPFWDMDPDGPEMMLNFLVAATDTTTENGATGVVPGSHRWSYRGEDAEKTLATWDEKDAVPVALKAGDCLLIGGRIVHRGGANTTDEHRRVMTVTVCSSCFTPEEPSVLIIDHELASGLSERAKKFLGYKEVVPFGSAGLWAGPADAKARVLGF